MKNVTHPLTIFHFFAASRHLRRAAFSSGVRLPVVARHNAARIFLENSGVIGSLGDFTPNIFMSSLDDCHSYRLQSYKLFPERPNNMAVFLSNGARALCGKESGERWLQTPRKVVPFCQKGGTFLKSYPLNSLHFYSLWVQGVTVKIHNSHAYRVCARYA